MTASERILGCDYGGRRTGLAVSDPTGTIAFPLGVVEADTPREAARRVARVAAEQQAAEILVGLPLLPSGERGAQVAATEEFTARLAEVFPGPIRSWDERLTTAQSERAVREMGGVHGRKGRVDEVAATLLLQSYLDSRRA